MEQKFSLSTKVYNTSIKLKIENFTEYDECNITELTSQKVKFAGQNVEWYLKVLMRAEKILMFSRDDKYVGFQLFIDDKNPKSPDNKHNKRLFKAEVKLEHSEQKSPQMSNNHPVVNNHHVKIKHLALNDEPDTKTFDYQEITDGSEICHEDGFCFSAPNYLEGGALVIIVNVWMKTAEVVDSAKKL